MDDSTVVLVKAHPSQRLSEVGRLGRMGSGRMSALGVGLRAPELVMACRAGNLSAPATESVLQCHREIPRNVYLAVERFDIDTLTALALIELGWKHDYQGRFPADVVIRARALVDAKEWTPADGAASPTRTEVVREWPMSEHSIGQGVKVRLICDYLMGELQQSDIREAAERIHDERREIVTAWRQTSVMVDDHIALIESKSPFAMTSARAVADIVVWVRPADPIGGPNPHRREVTVWQERPGLVNFAGVHEELGELEPGWQGDALSGSSVHGSKLDADLIIRTLVKYHVDRRSLVQACIKELLSQPEFEAQIRQGDAKCGVELLEWVKLSYL